MTEPTIDRYMTKSPHTVGHHVTLDAAHRLMREHGIRHLPVLEGGQLVGLVSQRDLHFIETLRDVDSTKVTVSEAMTQDVFTVGVGTPVRRIAAEMAEQKYGCAVVVDREHVVGVFTTVDALKVLVGLLDAARSS
jgi:acetoin utilization protein AcuB